MLLFYLLLAFLVFFLQNFLTLPSALRLDLLTVLLVFISLRERFIVAVSLALLLGLAMDCYGLAPLGLQAGLMVLAVVGVEILRRHINFIYLLPQIVGVGAIVSAQVLAMTLALHILLSVPVVYPAMVNQGLWQIVATALSAPLVLGIFGLVEKLWRRWFILKT